MLAARRQITAEIWLVLGVSLGASAVYAFILFVGDITAKGGLSNSTATLNGSLAPSRHWLDLALQLYNIAFALVPVLLAIHLLQRDHADARGLLGLNLKRPRFDTVTGVGLAAIIGIPGLILYVIARHLGINATVVAADLPHVWWRYPVLIISAIQNAVLEEVVIVGYLLTRLRELNWSAPRSIATSALIRGSYHLYQGLGGFFGNAIMGLIFGVFYRRFGRVTPLIVAHSILDIVSFVGYTLFAKHIGFLQ